MMRVTINRRSSRLGALRQRTAFGRRGVSLVEVLVVMAVLILGMLAIARLFPEGFQSLSFTGNITTTQRLISLREEEARKHRENLPDAIVGVDPTNPSLVLATLLPNNFLGSLSRLDVGGQMVDDPRYTGLNVARRVFGEQFQAPPPENFPATGGGQRLSLYRALFSPIYSAGPSPAGPGVSAYAGTPLQRVVLTDPPRFEDLDALVRAGHFGYGVNYENGWIYLVSFSQPSAGRLFKVEFTYRGAGGTGQSPADNTLVLAPGPTAQDPQDPVYTIQRFNLYSGQVDQTLTYNRSIPAVTAGPGSGASPGFVGLPAGAVLDAGSDFLYRRFRQLQLADAFNPADPFEFKVVDTVTGLLGLNPIAANYPLPNQDGRGIMVKVDYDVDDWSIMRYEDHVGAQPTDPDGAANSGDEYYSFKLPAGPIKRFGDVEETLNFRSSLTDNTFEYQTLVRNYPDSGGRTVSPLGVDVVVVDMQTGYQMDSLTLQRPDPGAPPGSNNSNGEIDYRAGVIRLWKFANRNAGGGAPAWTLPYSLGGGNPVTIDPAGRHLRVYYRTANDFAVASYKPFTRFHFQSNPAAPQQFREYAVSGGYLAFANQEAEKTVAVDYSYFFQPIGAPAPPMQRQTVYGELHQVQSPGAAGAPPGGRWWIRLNHADGVDPQVVPGSVQVLGVRGVSLHTRVTWLEGKRTRHRERSTLLTREVTR